MAKMIIKFPVDLVKVSEKHLECETVKSVAILSLAIWTNIMFFIATLAAPIFILKGML